MVGSQINQYKILEKIGSGGQGTVYKALDTKLNRTAVIKVLPPELTQKTANSFLHAGMISPHLQLFRSI